MTVMHFFTKSFCQEGLFLNSLRCETYWCGGSQNEKVCQLHIGAAQVLKDIQDAKLKTQHENTDSLMLVSVFSLYLPGVSFLKRTLSLGMLYP